MTPSPSPSPSPSPAAGDRPLRWGVLSTSAFAERRFLPGLRKTSAVEVVAVASRDRTRAEAFAARNGIPRVHDSYEALLADPDIDVVYNPLPNHLHVEWTQRAADAGKHVLCEKPMALDAASLETLRDAAQRVHLAEAFMVRRHPQWREVRDRVRAGELGSLTHAHVAFAFHNADPGDIRNTLDAGGGALYDIGCYAVVAARWFFEAEPVSAFAVMDRDPRFGTDRRTAGMVVFDDGRTVQFTVSTQSVVHQRVHLFGTEGRIELTVPFNHYQDAPVTYFTHAGTTLDGLDATPHVVPTADQYTLLAEWFCDLVRTGPPTPAHLDDAIRNARVLDALFRSERSGRLEAV